MCFGATGGRAKGRKPGMVDGAVLVVDAGEGPLAQTKSVVAKDLSRGIRPILLQNKVDRPSDPKCESFPPLHTHHGTVCLLAHRVTGREALILPPSFSAMLR